MMRERINYLFYLSLTVGAALLSFSKSLFFAKALSAADFGSYSLVMTSYVFIIYIGSFGANEYMLKAGTVAFSQNLRKQLLRIRLNSLFYGTAFTALTSFLSVALGLLLRNDLLLNVFIMSGMIAVPAVAYNILDSYFRCTQRYMVFSAMMFAKATSLLIFAYFFTRQFGLKAAIASEVISFVLIFGIVFLSTIKDTVGSELSSFAKAWPEMAKHGFATMLVYMTRNITLIVDRYFISFALGLLMLGKYSFVMIIYQSAVLGGGILTNVLGPKWLHLYSNSKDPQRLIKSIGKTIGIVFGFSFAFYPLFYLFFPSILGRYFYNYFSDDVILMSHITYWASVCYLLMSFLDWYFMALSKERITLITSIVSLLFLVISFSVCYLNEAGIIYYAYAFFLARCVSLLVMSISAYKLLKGEFL